MVRLLVAALCLLANGAFAQDADAPQRVEVVGSRIPRIDAETALPVQVVTREEIARSGVGNVEELLDRVSANAGGHHEAMGLGDADTPGFSGASLRGLGTGETLVLLNGRRLANYAFTSTSGPGVDLHVIPLAAIERVEILKDGASALYGSDAIAGVINFVTRQDYAGVDLDLGQTVAQHGGGARHRASLAGGIGDAAREGYNVFGVIDLRANEGLRALQRPYSATSWRPELGLENTSLASWPANIVLQAGGRTIRVNPAAPACTPQTVLRNGTTCSFDAAQTMVVVAPERQATALGRGTLRVADDTEAYAEVLAATDRILYTASPSPGMASGTASEASFVLPATSPYYPAGMGLSGDLTLLYRTVPLGGRRSEVRSDNLRALAGMRSRLGAWDVDAAASLNDSRSRETYLSGFVDAARLSAALATGQVNPFGPSGAAGAALLEATQIHGPSREAIGRTQSADLHATRETVDLPGGPLGLAVGAEARRETLADWQFAITGDVVGGGQSPPKTGGRRVQAAFVELAMPWVKGLELQAAARIDHYSDFGTAINPKLAIRVQPAREWLLRASIGRGFRAPSVPELYTQQTSSLVMLQDADSNPIGDPERCPFTHADSDCALQVQSVTGGNPALRPQRSAQANVGIVLESASGWHASLDWWSVDIRDLIGPPDGDDIANDLPRYDGSYVLRGPVDPNYPDLPGPITQVVTINENLGNWRVNGADLGVALRPVATALGKFSLQLDATVVRRARQVPTEGHVADRIGRLVPRSQYVASVNLDRGAWSTTLSQRFRQGYVDQNQLPDGSTRRVGSYRMWDGQLGWAWSRDVQWTLGVHNLFDAAPPFTNSDAQFQAGYDPSYADPLGRTFTLGLRVAWR